MPLLISSMPDPNSQIMESNKDEANGEHHVNGENHGESGDVGSRHDWLKGDRCIQCNKRSGRVLVCSENGCPVAAHEACMTWKPVFDDMGNFYCSYSLYKRERARFEESRMKNDAVENNLEVGDACAFELIKCAQTLMKVTIHKKEPVEDANLGSSLDVIGKEKQVEVHESLVIKTEESA